MMFGMCQVMDSGLRLYGHPQLLAVAESINGSDFTPFNDAIVAAMHGIDDGTLKLEASNVDRILKAVGR